jgi:hypothetical protein
MTEERHTTRTPWPPPPLLSATTALQLIVKRLPVAPSVRNARPRSAQTAFPAPPPLGLSIQQYRRERSSAPVPLASLYYILVACARVFATSALTVCGLLPYHVGTFKAVLRFSHRPRGINCACRLVKQTQYKAETLHAPCRTATRSSSWAAQSYRQPTTTSQRSPT